MLLWRRKHQIKRVRLSQLIEDISNAYTLEETEEYENLVYRITNVLVQKPLLFKGISLNKERVKW